jgi:error-prone DNA polymerase
VSGYVHLHSHTTWSLLDGAIPAEALPHAAAYLGFEAIAMTDHDSLLGAVRFQRGCEAAGIKPIFGAELTLADGHVTVLAKNARGYGNLCRLISDAHLSNTRGKPHTTFTKLAERAEGLFVLSGCERGEVARLAAAGDMPGAIAAARQWRDAIGENYRIEVFDHRGYGHRTLRDRLLVVAREAGIQAVAANDIHYAAPLEAATHEVLHAIKEIVPLSATQALRRTSEYHLKDPTEMRALFCDLPEVCDETLAIAEACDFTLDLDAHHFPDFPIPSGETPTSYLARRCFDGAARRYGRIGREVEARLNHELNLIFKMGFASYFLLVADIVDAIRAMGIRCACRGSATGSLVCFCLGISDVDPVRYDLLFERFMNTRRDELPDIDIDVESARREDVLDHILSTYGSEQVAVCCMVDTFRARMAIRDVGKAMGLPAEEIDLVAKAFPRIAARDISAAIERLPELAGSNMRAGQLEQLFSLCEAIDGFPRHLALHPSGVVLASDDLADRVPMQESFQGFRMLQADKDDVEELGFVKLDILGLRMLSAITHASTEIKRVRDEDVDVDELPRDDPATFELIRSSKTLGCFQIESPGQRELLARLQPESFEDLIVEISLFRPGPVKSDMVTPYLQRRHGFEDVRYPHECLRAILAESYGIVVFHEQLIRVIAATTGCSLDDADYVRRHLDAGRPAAADSPDDRPKRTYNLGEDWVKEQRVHYHGPAGRIEIAPPAEDVEGWFRAAAVHHGFTEIQVDALWKEVFAFASFGFCKSHAAAFALPTFISAYLKAHYPAEFLAGVLTHEPGMYPRRSIISDARQMGVAILPLDVNSSSATYRVEPVGDRYGIRLALAGVRAISDAEIASIERARDSGPFTSLEDLWRRCELSRPVLENLVHVGALDAIETRSRRELLWRVAELCAEARRAVGDQLQLPLDATTVSALPDLPGYTQVEETEAELEVAGVDASRHVMDLYAGLVAELECISAADLPRTRNRSQVWVAGVKMASQTPAIRSGQRIIFVTLDDPTGPIDVTVFERVQPRCARTVLHSWLLLVKGELRKRGGASFTRDTQPGAVGITLVVEEVFDLSELAADRAEGLSLHEALDRQRALQAVGGAPNSAQEAPSRLWHASGGSAGR